MHLTGYQMVPNIDWQRGSFLFEFFLELSRNDVVELLGEANVVGFLDDFFGPFDEWRIQFDCGLELVAASSARR
jgi:hypothetical protein